jgi:copper resistance protein C
VSSRKSAVGVAMLLLLSLAAVVPAFLPVIRVSAHASYNHSTPGDGEVVATAPAKVAVFFKEEIRRGNGLPTLIVVDDAGDEVDAGSVLDDSDRTHISDALKPGLPDGRYTVIWHTVSDDDSEEAQGSFHFYVGGVVTPVPTAAPSSSAPSVAPTIGRGSDSTADIPTWGLILGIIAGLVVGTGGGMVVGRLTGS